MIKLWPRQDSGRETGWGGGRKGGVGRSAEVRLKVNEKGWSMGRGGVVGWWGGGGGRVGEAEVWLKVNEKG